MKTKQVLTVMITSLFILYGCANNDASVQALASKNSTLAKSELGSNASGIHRAYPKEQAEVLKRFGEIATSITKGAGQGPYSEFINELISYHAYGAKFVEFNGGESFNSVGNENTERHLFGEYLDEWDYDVNQFAAVPGTLKVAVYYGNVANLTFTSDFILTAKESGEEFTVNNLITLLFVKTGDEWEMVHEHHSPVNVVASPVSLRDDYPVIPGFSGAQLDVVDRFMEIRQSIIDGAGKGYDSEFMDELISFHTYGPKFVEFNNGLSFDSEGNEHNERQLFGEMVDIGGVKKFAAVDGTLNIGVYNENVANLTFLSDFELEMDGVLHKVNNLITLLFVKTMGEWQLVHEHHSPYKGQNLWQDILD